MEKKHDTTIDNDTYSLLFFLQKNRFVGPLMWSGVVLNI